VPTATARISLDEGAARIGKLTERAKSLVDVYDKLPNKASTPAKDLACNIDAVLTELNAELKNRGFAPEGPEALEETTAPLIRPRPSIMPFPAPPVVIPVPQ
jgi:hypothetical protein